MQRRRTAVQEAWTFPAFGYLSGYLAFMAGIFLFLYWLLQPVTITNAGQSAYIPPPQTRLVPLARKMDAPDPAQLADVQPLNVLSTLAQVEDAKPLSSKESGRRAKKRDRTETATRESRRSYAYDRHLAYRSYARYSSRGYRW
jgi:hypothetical protein